MVVFILPAELKLRWSFGEGHRFKGGFTCPKLTIETLEQDVKYVQS